MSSVAPRTSDAPTDGFRRWARYAPEVAVVLLAFFVRAWALRFAAGVPEVRPDEEIFVARAMHMFGPEHDPRTFEIGWPEGFFILIHLMQRAYAWILSIQYGQPVHMGCLYAIDPIRITQLGRILSCVFGTATIPLTMALTRRVALARVGLDGARSASLLAGLFLAVDTLHARDSHFGVSDAGCVFFIMLGALFAARAFAESKSRWLLASAAAMALGASIKYTAVAYTVLIAISALLAPAPARVPYGVRTQVTARRIHWALALVASGLTFIATFVLANPDLIAQRAQFYSGLLSHQGRFDQAALGWGWDLQHPRDIGIDFHTFVTLPISLGWPLFVLGALGVTLSLVDKNRMVRALAWMTALFYVVVLGNNTLPFMRYTLPVHPALCIFAACMLVRIDYRLFAHRLSTRARHATLAVAAIALSIMPLSRAILVDMALARQDTRELASAWLIGQQQSRDGDQSAASDNIHMQIIDPDVAAVCMELLPPELHRDVPLAQPGHSSARASIERGEPGYGAVADQILVPHQDIGAHWWVNAVPLLPCGREGMSSTRHLPACMVERIRFSAGVPSCDAVFDTRDMFYLPIAGLSGEERPGPEVIVYENECSSRP